MDYNSLFPQNPYLDCVWRFVCLFAAQESFSSTSRSFAYKKAKQIYFLNQMFFPIYMERMHINLITFSWCEHPTLINTANIYLVIKKSLPRKPQYHGKPYILKARTLKINH